VACDCTLNLGSQASTYAEFLRAGADFCRQRDAILLLESCAALLGASLWVCKG
jgi:hypothetical protein